MDTSDLLPFPEEGTDNVYTLSEANMKLPVFETTPEDAYIVRNVAATLRCKAAPASQVYFR